jgi:hypothetical protein
MNKQIEKLIDDAKLTAVCEMFENELVEFARLIVDECLSHCEDERDLRAIKDHFGVK